MAALTEFIFGKVKGAKEELDQAVRNHDAANTAVRKAHAKLHAALDALPENMLGDLIPNGENKNTTRPNGSVE